MLILATAHTAAAQTARRADVIMVRAENTLGVARPDETISVPWRTVRTQLPAADSLHVRVVDEQSGREIVAQAVDNDGDGALDELIFQASFFPGEVKSFVVEASAPRAAPSGADRRVFVAHEMPRDDLAWESDRIAFRMYGQGLAVLEKLVSSGVDVWTKRVRSPVIEKWYAKDGKNGQSYHHDTGEGADFFDVGETLGAGGTAIWRDDKLYHSANFKSYRILANGPVRAAFELTYDPWDANGLRVSETKRISIDAGQNLSRAVSTFHAESGGTSAEIPYAVGVIKHKGAIGSESKANSWAWITAWETVDPKAGGHGDLGIAVVLPRDRVADWKEISNHYLAISHARSGEPVVHYVGAGWTGNGDFRDVGDWWSYLTQFAQRLETPLKVTLSKNGAILSSQ